MGSIGFDVERLSFAEQGSNPCESRIKGKYANVSSINIISNFTLIELYHNANNKKYNDILKLKEQNRLEMLQNATK